jgi:hypothetical protein
MARKRKSDPDETLGRVIRSYYEEAMDAISSRHTVWDDARKRLDPVYTDPSKVQVKPKVKVPYVWRTVRTQMSQIVQSIRANGQWIIARSTTPDHGDAGQVVTQLLENQFRWKGSTTRDSNEWSIFTGAQMGLTYGNQWWLLQPEEHEDGFYVKWKALDPFDVFPDWKAHRWYILRRYIPVWQVQDIAATLSAPVVDEETGEPLLDDRGRPILRDGGRAQRAFEALVKDIRENGPRARWDSKYYNHENDRQSTLGRVSSDDLGDSAANVDTEVDPMNARVTLLEWHETARNGMIAKILPCFGSDGGDLVLQKEKNAYGCCTIVEWNPYAVDEEAFGYGIPEIVSAMDDVLSYSFREQARLIGRVSSPPILFRKTLRLREQFLRSPSNVAQPVDDPQTDVRYMDPPSNPMLASVLQNLAKMAADMGSGESDIRRGEPMGAGSATEASIAERAGSINDQLLFSSFAMAMEQGAFVMLQILKVHLTEEMAIPQLGRDTDQFLMLKPEYLRGTFEVQFGGAPLGATPLLRQAQLRQIWTTYGPSGALDPTEFARADLEMIGRRDADRFLIQKQGPPPVSPRHEHVALLQWGQKPIVSLKDDHARHYAEHAQELALWAQQFGPNDPRVQTLQAHVQATVAVLQMMMSQQGMVPQAGQGGARPFQPEQAGMPGQPRAFNAATAGIHAERQAPNIGAAPQPAVAPNRQPGAVIGGGGSR